MLKIEWPKPDDGPVSRASRYTLKGDPYSSHSVILDWLGDGRGRRLLDVGAADGLLSRRLTERGWKVTGLEADPAAAAAGAAHCERMIVADLRAGAPLPGGAAALARARAGGRPRAERAQRARDAAPARLPVRRRGQARVSQTRAPKVVVVMPAYNAGRTLRMTYEQLPKDTVNLVILVDDGSTDATLDVARQLGLEIFVHNRNYGYGANQKTCYTEALHAGADVVVMVHPDYQYDPTLVPQIIEPITRGAADVVLGSRLKSGSALARGLPSLKVLANPFLRWVVHT